MATSKEHESLKANFVVVVIASAMMYAAVCLPSLALARFSFKGLDNLGASVVGSALVWLVFTAAHVPAGMAWARAKRRGRGAFAVFVLAPAVVGAAVAALFAAWSIFPLLVLMPVMADDVYTAAVALSLPGGGRFKEVADRDGGRWIKVSYEDGSDYHYSPRLSG